MKDWNEFWSKYRVFKIEREWLESNYPEVLKAWKEHRQPIILKKIHDEEQDKQREIDRLLDKFNQIEEWLDSKPNGLGEDMEKAIRMSIELGRNDDDNIHNYWTAIRTLARNIDGYPIRR